MTCMTCLKHIVSVEINYYGTVKLHTCIGASDNLQPINNISIWTYAMEKESKATPRFYPYSFQLQAEQLLNTLGIERCNITAENCVSIYKYLVDNI